MKAVNTTKLEKNVMTKNSKPNATPPPAVHTTPKGRPIADKTPAELAEDKRVNDELAAQAAAVAAARVPYVKIPRIQTPHGDFRVGSQIHEIYKCLVVPLESAMTLKQIAETVGVKFGKDVMQVYIAVRLAIGELQNPKSKNYHAGLTIGNDAAGRHNAAIVGRVSGRGTGQSPEALAAKAAELEAAAVKSKARAEAAVAKASAMLEKARVSLAKRSNGIKVSA